MEIAEMLHIMANIIMQKVENKELCQKKEFSTSIRVYEYEYKLRAPSYQLQNTIDNENFDYSILCFI